MLGRIILGGVYGFIASLSWTFALGFPLMSGWLYGVVIGAILSLIIFFKHGGNVRGNASIK